MSDTNYTRNDGSTYCAFKITAHIVSREMLYLMSKFAPDAPRNQVTLNPIRRSVSSCVSAYDGHVSRATFAYDDLRGETCLRIDWDDKTGVLQNPDVYLRLETFSTSYLLTIARQFAASQADG